MLKIVPQKRHQIGLEQKRHVLERERGGGPPQPEALRISLRSSGLPARRAASGASNNSPIEDGSKTKRAANMGQAIIMPCG